MEDPNKIKEMVKEKYGKIADQSAEKNKTSCCGSGESKVVFSVFADDYTKKTGYVSEADLGLGCGLPTDYADIKPGDTIVDLGSGAGNDAFIARSIVGEHGKVIGIDMTPEMIDKANGNRQRLGFENVEFHLAEIESTPLENDSVDVVVSNCVLNLSPEKEEAFKEINRILKPGGHFCVSDIVLVGNLPEGLRKSAEMYAGCVAGAVQQNEYLQIIEETGFDKTEIKKSKRINLPEDLLNDYLDKKELDDFKKGKAGIFSITVVGFKK